MIYRRKRQHGNALVEFAIASTILIPCLAGTFQFGYTFYVYNLLESAVANGSRYAAYRTYREASGSDVEKVKLAVKNMAVYGTPDPVGNAVPTVRNLKPENIDVKFTLDPNGLPTAVEVEVKEYVVNSVFKKYKLTGKPSATLPYLGRYAPQETEN